MERCACRSRGLTSGASAPGGASSDFAPPGTSDRYAPDLRLEPVHVELSLSVDVLGRKLEVRQRLTVRAKAAGTRALVLDGVDLRELRAELPDRGRSHYDGRVLTLIWEQPFQAGEERSLELEYSVIEPATGVLFSAPDALYPEAPTFAVTDHETERARYWLASIDHPSARPTLDIQLRAEARFTLLANGALVREEAHADGTKTAHYSQTSGCPSYLVCFAVGDFVRWDGGELDGVPIAAFAPRPFTVEHAQRSFGRTREMLAFLTRTLGMPYPFAKYYQFVAEGIGGAMENISLVSWDSRFLLDAVLEAEERELVDVVNVHEMAHSWFGDHVVCRDFAHAWLKEGWATYMESCWLEHQQGPDALAYDLWCHADVYFAEVEDRYARPIVTRKYDSSFDLFDGHLYPGAALRIHMLRKELGDEVFWPAVRDYLGRHAGQVVETDDFRRALEARSGLSLERFFEQWFLRPGYPDLEVSFRHDPHAGEGVFEIVQKQADEKTNEGALDFQLDLAFGSEARLQHRRVRVSGRRTLAVVALDAAPDVIRIDPDGRTLHRLDFNPGTQLLLRQLEAKDARGRIQAGVLLACHGGRVGAEALRAAFEAEPYFGVRVKWAEALGKAASEAALQALLALAEGHADPRSLAALLKALGKYKDPRVTQVLCRRLDGELPYRASEAALEALGAQRDGAPLERLLGAAERTGFGGFVQAGALRALGASRRVEALEALARALVRGQVPNSARHAAAEGLGALATALPDGPRERAIEALTAALRDPLPRVQLAAARALGRARATSAEPALSALAQRLPRQDAAQIRRVLRDLRRGADKAGRPRELDELQERLRKLSAQVEELEARLSSKLEPEAPR